MSETFALFLFQIPALILGSKALEGERYPKEIKNRNVTYKFGGFVLAWFLFTEEKYLINLRPPVFLLQIGALWGLAILLVILSHVVFSNAWHELFFGDN